MPAGDTDQPTHSRRWRLPSNHWLAVTAATVLLGVVGVAAWRLWPREHTFYTDADTINVPAARAALREILWQPPIRLSAPINSAADDYEPRISADGRMLFLVRGKAGHNADLYAADRAGDGWQEPRPLARVNSAHDDLGPEPSPDGTGLYFYSNRPGGSGGYDLWVSHRSSETGGWTEPANLGPQVNSPFNDYGPALTADGAALYFASNRPRPDHEEAPDPQAWPATVREDLHHHDYDLYAAPLTDRGAGRAEPLAALNSPRNEGTPAVSPTGDFVYFSSDRPGGAGGFDLYRSRVVDDRHRPPEHLGFTVNTPANELDPTLCLGGYELHFSSDRAVAAADGAIDAGYDVYRTTSREVFSDTVITRPDFDWAAFWTLVLPPLLWALLALLLLWLLRHLFDAATQRKLSLLARCLLLSLLAHALLMFLLSLWQVTATLAGTYRQRGGIKVSLASPAMGQTITTLLRGGFSDFQAPEVSPRPIERPPLTPPAQPAPAAPTAEVPVSEPAPARPTEVEAVAVDASPRYALPVPTDTTAVGLDAARPEARPALEIDVPAPADAERAGEARLAMEMPASAAPPRPELPAEFVPAPALADVTRPVPTPASVEDAAATESSIDAVTGRDAAPDALHRTSPPRTAPQPAPLDPPAALELALPHAEHALRRQEVPENTRALPPSGRPAPRFAAPSPTDDRPAAVAAFELPAPSGPTRTDTASTVALDVEAPDAPADTRRAPPAVTAPAPGGAPATPLDLSLPEQRPGRAEAAVENAAALPPVHSGEPALRPHLPEPQAIAPERRLPLPPPPRAAAPEATPSALLERPIAEVAGTASPGPPRSAFEAVPASLLATGPLPLADLPFPESDALSMTGGVFGVVLDAFTDEPLAGATVVLDLADDAAVTATTDEAGFYDLSVPAVPDFFAVSASAERYLPASANVSAAAVNTSTVQVNFFLRPEGLDEVAIETTPDVHHLGDDRFTGSVNSRFQKRAEGDVYAAEFTLSERQVPPYYTRAELSMLAKGIQLRHRLFVNGHRLPGRPPHSPRDGSFGECRIPFDADCLRPGVNILEFRANNRRGDVDDFEFVNIQIHLKP